MSRVIFISFATVIALCFLCIPLLTLIYTQIWLGDGQLQVKTLDYSVQNQETSAQNCTVLVKQGWIQGEQIELVTGDGKYYSYKGIPYATPPVGKLRFKDPQPPDKWLGIRNATIFGEVCPQCDKENKICIFRGSEDCLTLNIYTMTLNPEKLLPVMFYIHSGQFQWGNGNIDGPDFLIPNEVVLVTINYRLGAIGFLCLDTEDVPGNAGMKDQVAAMRWVQENIVQFGGDPGNITIFGQGAAVGYHLYSPMSRGLFQKAILMSSSMLDPWMKTENPKLLAFALGKNLGIKTESPKVLLDYLQSLRVKQILIEQPSVFAIDIIMKAFYRTFTVSVEKDLGIERFLTDNPEQLVMKVNDNAVNILAGSTDFEGLHIYSNLSAFMSLYDSLMESYVPKDLLIRCTPTQSLALYDKITNHYFGSLKYFANTTCFLNFYSDNLTIKLQFFIEHLIPEKYAAKRYYYTFSAVTERNALAIEAAPLGLVGAAHGEDLFYLFNVDTKNQPPIDKYGKSYKVIKLLSKLWTNFAKFGNPTPDSSLGVIWPEYDNEVRSFMDISEELTPMKQPFNKSLAFWKSLYEDACQN